MENSIKTPSSIKFLNTSTQTLTRFGKDFIPTPENVGRMILKRAMRKDEIKFNDRGRAEYLQSWADHSNENFYDERDDHKPEEVVDSVADHLVYASSLHIIGDGDIEVSSGFRLEVYNEIVILLELSLNA